MAENPLAGYSIGETNVDWFIYRPIMAGKATLHEVKTILTMVDMLDLHEALDIEEEINSFISKKKGPK
jgi:hypothetical protein